MTSRLLISLSLLLAWQKACAQLAPADDFFNGGAQFYISNNIPSALERVEAGRKLYPDDVKLKKLEELLKQQQQSQSQQSQQQQNQQDQSQQQQDKQQSRQQKQNSQDQQKQDQQKQNQADQNKNEQQQQQERQKSPAEKKDGQQNGQDQAVAAGQMTPEEAGQLLDAQKDNEQILQLKPQGKPEDQNRPIKDW
jgi:outer membrane biosynthesis protein TonB